MLKYLRPGRTLLRNRGGREEREQSNKIYGKVQLNLLKLGVWLLNTFGDTQTILVELVKAVGLAMVQRETRNLMHKGNSH